MCEPTGHPAGVSLTPGLGARSLSSDLLTRLDDRQVLVLQGGWASDGAEAGKSEEVMAKSGSDLASRTDAEEVEGTCPPAELQCRPDPGMYRS